MPTPANFEIIKVLADLIESELELPPQPPRVFIYNQRWKLPNYEGMFVLIEFLGSKVFGSRLGYVNSADGETLLEVKSHNTQETYQVKVFSADSEARVRNHEIVLALNSTAAQQLQEKFAFKLANLPIAFNDISEVEASARLNTYAIRFNALRKYEVSKPVEFFDQFPQPTKPILTNP